MTTTSVHNPVTPVRYVAGAWLGVIALTVLSWCFSTDHALALGAKGIDTAILLVSFAKMFVISHTFMEQRHAAGWLRLSFAGWYALVCGALLALYWI